MVQLPNFQAEDNISEAEMTKETKKIKNQQDKHHSFIFATCIKSWAKL